MQAEIQTHEDQLVTEFVERMNGAWMAQATMTTLRDREERTPADAQQLRADASELRYIKSQPTADEIILRSIGLKGEFND